MSLWDTIKTWVKTVWNVYRNSRKSSWDTYTDTVSKDKTNDTWKQTLNEQIANWSINNTTTNTNNNKNNTATTSSGFDLLKELNNNVTQPSTPIDTKTVQTTTPTSVADKEEEDFWTKLNKWSDKAYNKVQNRLLKVGSKVWNEVMDETYRDKEESYALWYDPDKDKVYYLDLNEWKWFWFYRDTDLGTRNWVEERFIELYNEANNEISNTWDYEKALYNFYDKAKTEWLFRLREGKNYIDSDWWPLKFNKKRYSSIYTQEELDSLAQSWKTTKWVYKDLTFDEFLNFLDMWWRNKSLQSTYSWTFNNAIWRISSILGWNLWESDTQEFNIDWWFESNWMSKMRGLSLNNIDGILSSMYNKNPQAATEARLTYSSDILWDLLPRWYNIVSSIYEAEREILSRDKSTWSWYDTYLLEKAEIARKMDEQFAKNINDVFRQIVTYWADDNWEITTTPDIFEYGESLNDILTLWLREISWFKDDWWRWSEEQRSALDIIEWFTNDAMYMYNQDKGWKFRQAWNEVEYGIRPVWQNLWEGAQVLYRWLLTLEDFWTVGQLKRWLLREYMDQDATIFRLLETDDKNITRAVKRYWLKWAEYGPEVVWNLIPDIIAYKLLWPGAAGTAFRHIKDIKTATKLTRAAEWASMLNKLKVITWIARWEEAMEALGLWARKYKQIINAAKAAKWWKYFQRIKTWAQLLDRMVTEVWLWQFMDAQWSAYDTEPYSQASFLMSVVWSGLFDVLPSLSRLTTWKWFWKNIFWWESIWSLARYIDSSPEAAKYIATALRKWTWEIWIEELEAFVKDFWTIEEAARQAYNKLKPAEQAKIWELTKWLVYSYINQAFWNNSTMGKRVRQILANKNSNLADVVKYVARIPWTVSVWPYVSTIRLKNWTRVNIYATGKEWQYSAVLDSVFWWFDKKITNWFTQEDLDKLSKIDWYSNVEKNKSKWFDAVTTEGKGTRYYLNKDWLKHFWLKPENITLESLWVSLKEAENTREALTKIKWAKWVNISDRAVDNLAETWWYDEITSKVKEVLWC